MRGGGWNELIKIDRKKALKSYQDTLKYFYDLLKDGGVFYVDKFKDSETTHKVVVANMKVVGQPVQELIFWTQRFPKQKIRRASMIRKDSDGTEHRVPNITYDLSEKELQGMMKTVGFRNIKRLRMKTEKHFNVLIAQK